MNMTKKILTFLCAAAAVSVSSCWHPPFDPLISASEFTVDKLGAPVWSRTVTLWDEAEGGYYLPNRDPSEYYTGAWVRRKNGTINIGKLTMYAGDSFDFNANRYSATDTSGSSTVVITPPGTNTAESVVYVASNHEGMYRLNSASPEYWPPADPVIAVGTAPYVISSDQYYMAVWNGSFMTIQFVAASITLSGTTSVPVTYPSPIPVAPAFVAASPMNVNTYYLSGRMANGRDETYFWADSTLNPVRLPISRKLTGILSDGRLLADTGERLYVYGADGTDVFSIPTGALHFANERTIDGFNWYSVFTRTVQIPDGKNDDGSDYLIEIYEIPTADLRDLAE